MSADSLSAARNTIPRRLSQSNPSAHALEIWGAYVRDAAGGAVSNGGNLLPRPWTIDGDGRKRTRRRDRLSAKMASPPLPYRHLRTSRALIEKPELTFPAAVMAGCKKPLDRSTPDARIRIHWHRIQHRAAAYRACCKWGFPAPEKEQSAVMALSKRNKRNHAGP